MPHPPEHGWAEPRRQSWTSKIDPGFLYKVKRLLLSVLLLPAIPAQADPAAIQCPGQNTIEMRWCAAQNLRESNKALQHKLSPTILETWKRTTQEVCAAAYVPVKQGTIYPQMVVGCDDRLNRSLLDEFTRLGH